MKKAISIKQIAEELGLSRNTVSKALNGQPVPEKTRELVLRKASELNYKSINFDVNKAKKYRILLLSGKPLHNIEFYLPVIESIENCCYDNHYELFQYTYNSATTSFEAIARHVSDLKVDGVVAIECFDPEFIVKFAALGIPMSFIDFPGNKFELNVPFDLVCCTDQKQICEYVKTLIDQFKVHRFSFVGDYRHCLSFHERYMGMIRALVRSGRSFHQENDILEPDDSFDYGDVASLKKRIKSLPYVPEVVLCCNDFVARQVVRALDELGHRVPEDVLVVGFDGTSCAENELPQLTTFNVDKYSLGREAFRTLVDRIEHKNSPTRIIMMSCELVIRASTTR